MPTMEQCKAEIKRMSVQDQLLHSAYVIFLAGREYYLARDQQADVDALQDAYDRSLDDMEAWANARPEFKKFLGRVFTSEGFLELDASGRFVQLDQCDIHWPTLACYFYGVAEPSGDILKASEEGSLEWFEMLICPARLLNEKGPRETGWPVWAKIGLALGIAGTSIWMVHSLVKRGK